MYHPTAQEPASIKENMKEQSSIAHLFTAIRSFFTALIKDRAYFLLLIIVLAINLPIYYYRIHYPVDGDFSLHLLFTRYWISGNLGQIPVANLSHPALQLVLAGLISLTLHKIPLRILLLLLLIAAQVFSATILYLWIGSKKTKKNWDILRAAMAALVTVVAPIMALAPFDRLFYFGYVGLANYHNPTVILLRPFALGSFILSLNAYSSKNSWGKVVLAGSLVIVSALIKPNYLLCIVPALLGLALIFHLQNRFVDWRFLLWGYLLPSVITLGVQWWIAYVSASDGGQIMFSLLGVESAFSSFLFPKFLLSIVFPAAVMVWHWRKLDKRPAMLLGWAGFLIGAAQMYFLAEGGEYFYHGNFRWSAQIMLFLLFAVSVKDYLWFTFDADAGAREKVIPMIVFLAHTVAGIAYIVHCFVSTGYA
jgi:hypothetical protein